jgi:hypothetical protein
MGVGGARPSQVRLELSNHAGEVTIGETIDFVGQSLYPVVAGQIVVAAGFPYEKAQIFKHRCQFLRREDSFTPS